MPENDTATPAQPTAESSVLERDGAWFYLSKIRRGREKYVFVVSNVWGTTEKSVFENLAKDVLNTLVTKFDTKKPKVGRIKGDHPIKDLARQLGGMKEVAQALNVTPQTVHRWTTVNPAPPHKRTLEALNSLLAKYNLPSVFNAATQG